MQAEWPLRAVVDGTHTAAAGMRSLEWRGLGGTSDPHFQARDNVGRRSDGNWIRLLRQLRDGYKCGGTEVLRFVRYGPHRRSRSSCCACRCHGGTELILAHCSTG